jgi:thioredoxin
LNTPVNSNKSYQKATTTILPLQKLKISMATLQLTTQGFKEKVFNYVTEKDWNYQGTLPAIIDFYADWCGPCKMVAPILEELSKEYEGRVVIYKVNTDEEQELSAVFGIQSIPTMLFIDAFGEPMLQPGAFPKHTFKKIIEEQLLTEVKSEE